MKELKQGKLSDEGFGDNILEKVKKQIDDQDAEELPKAWPPLKDVSIERKERLANYLGVPLRMAADKKWSLFGVLYDAINILDAPLANLIRVGIREDKINPYLYRPTRGGRTRDVRVGEYAHRVESLRPLFGVFWDFYKDWLVEILLDELNATAKKSVKGVHKDIFYK